MTSSVSDIKLTTGSKCPNCGRTGPLEQHFPCELVAACPRCGYCGECGDLIELPRYGEELTRQQKKQKRYGRHVQGNTSLDICSAIQNVVDAMSSVGSHPCAGWDCATCKRSVNRAALEEILNQYLIAPGGITVARAEDTGVATLLKARARHSLAQGSVTIAISDYVKAENAYFYAYDGECPPNIVYGDILIMPKADWLKLPEGDRLEFHTVQVALSPTALLPGSVPAVSQTINSEQ